MVRLQALERLFQRETGMTFGKWRQQLRLLHALRLLAAGRPVTAVDRPGPPEEDR